MRVAAALALALAAAACGSSRQESLRDEYRTACDGIAPGATLAEVQQLLSSRLRGDRVAGAECRTDWAEAPAPDQCADPPARVCILRWQWFLTDPGLCGLVGSPCADYCEVRVTGSVNDPATPVCAREFLPRQLPLF